MPAGMTLGEFMAEESRKGLEQRLLHHPAVGKGTDQENRRVYYERLDTELKVITQMGFPGYFMIVADFIQWAKNNTIPVGPGRGSGAVHWSLTHLKSPTWIQSNLICCLSVS